MLSTSPNTLWRRRQWLTLAGASALTACVQPHTEPLRIATHQWIGHEFLHLAQRSGTLAAAHVRLIDMPSSSACMRALTAGAIEGACMSLDQVLVARERGTPLTVVAIMDKSMGADAIISHADITELSDLKGRRLGIDLDSASSILLVGALATRNLTIGGLSIVNLSVDNYLSAFFKHEVDALIVQEPYKTLLSLSDINVLFTSNDFPDQIVNTIVVRTDLLEKRAASIKVLVEAYFRTLEQWQENPNDFLSTISKHSVAEPSLLIQAFEGIKFLSATESRAMLTGNTTPLHALATRLAELMVRYRLLRHAQSMPTLDRLTDNSFHPIA